MERPVRNIPVAFEWQKGPWVEIFDEHVKFIQQDVLRALSADRFVVYLSCPISSRGGSIALTNLEVADATARRLTTDWGSRFWFLNPGQYQLESKHGLGLITRHAEILRLRGRPIDIHDLLTNHKPGGGDYMRMWTRVLAEDGQIGEQRDLGGRFSAFYFLAPSDVAHFFTAGGQQSLSDGVEAYFARKFATDAQFNAFFSRPFLDETGAALPDQDEEWDRRRKEFFLYYTVRASAAFSRGSHDEWNIWVAINQLRLENPKMGIGAQIPGFFEGRQVDPASAGAGVLPGYAVPETLAPLRAFPAYSPATPVTSRSRAAEALGTQGISGASSDKSARTS